MAVTLELKGIFSMELEYGKLPLEPECCAILIELSIGIKGQEGGDIFSFTAITPEFLIKKPELRWGRGYLLLEYFSWQQVEKMAHNLLRHVVADSWEEATQSLTKELHWEYENYQGC
ncbi:hypothetical protein CWC16_13610 [Pseudoalteromonas sp. S3776]|uniref:Imm8 family immunity protein n=1 Tax=Pseudoalteromonas sp. S3776 TaxID=579544 RepID=UPI001109FC1D|nr:Imm8 family immunity protein [Pseudoalteromonas sp. S3776]TMO79290.1 hypothetical protein CWC16_13610 [Pseudoalteromonas sp. S3776]